MRPTSAFQANGPLSELTVFYGDSVPEKERANYNFIVIGRPSQLPIVKDFNEKLPAPFEGAGDQATEKNLQVTYRITPDAALGTSRPCRHPGAQTR